jgi:hypothetical protein
MRLPTVKKILREDVKEAPSWISRVIEPFNSVAETLYQAMNKNITFSENIRCFTKEISYKTTSMYPVMDDVQFANELRVKATGLLVVQAINSETYEPEVGTVYAPWTEDNGTIVVRSITGLTASTNYTIRLLIF